MTVEAALTALGRPLRFGDVEQIRALEILGEEAISLERIRSFGPCQSEYGRLVRELRRRNWPAGAPVPLELILEINGREAMAWLREKIREAEKAETLDA